MQSRFIILIGVVFSNGTMLPNALPRDHQINEITYSRGVAKCPWNLLGNWLIAAVLPVSSYKVKKSHFRCELWPELIYQLLGSPPAGDSHNTSIRLPVFSISTFPAVEDHRPYASTSYTALVTEARRCE